MERNYVTVILCITTSDKKQQLADQLEQLENLKQKYLRRIAKAAFKYVAAFFFFMLSQIICAKLNFVPITGT